MKIAKWMCLLVFMVQEIMNTGGLAFGNSKKSVIKYNTKDRIFEGKFADPNQFPWTAAIYRNKFDYKKMKPTPNSHSFGCGGTIISPHFILTAAHCVFHRDQRIGVVVYDFQAIDFRVVVGLSDIAGNSLEMLQVQKVYPYEKYNKESTQNDIALLKLRHPLKFNNATQAVKLQREVVVGNGQMATIAGWGDTCQPNHTFAHLRFASVRIMPFEHCVDTKITEPIIEETAFCVGPDKHSANGDSGSGMWMEINGQNYLIGIVSIGPPCGANNLSVFTNALYFYNWIIENMNKS